MRHIGRIFARLAGGACLLAIAGCGAPLYNVAPLPAALPAGMASGRTPGGLSVGAALIDEDRAIDEFDANLPLAGIVAVDLQLANGAAEQVKVDRLKLTLEDAAGQSYRPIKPQWALGRLMKFYGDRIYFVRSYRETRARYVAVALPLDGRLAAGEERRGIVFFGTRRDSTALTGLSLSVGGGKTPVKLRLN